MFQTPHRRSLIILAVGSILIGTLSSYIVTALAQNQPSAIGAWSRTGPIVGVVNAVAVAPSKPTTVYAGVTSNSGGFGGTSTTGVYKTTDGGLTWSPAGLNGKNVYCLAVDPGNFNRVYAGTYQNGVYKSTDGGASWNGPYVSNSGSTDVYTLAIDPVNTSVLYASATNLGLIKSTDEGLTWNTIDNGIHYYLLHGIAVDPANTKIVYAAGGHGSSGGVYKSTDGGASWNVSSTGIPDSPDDVAAIALSQTSSATLYVVTGHDVYKSTDAGAHWSQSSTGLPGSRVTCVATDPLNSQVVFAGTNTGVFKSTNGGGNWNSTTLSSLGVNALALETGQSTNLYAGTQGSGVFKTTNAGTTWVPSSNTPYGDVRELAIDPTNPGIIYANTSDSVYKSADHAGSWLATPTSNHVTLLRGIPTHRLVIDPSNPATLYVGVDFLGVLKSTNGGASWTTVFQENINIGGLAIDPANPQILYLDSYPFELRKSIDGGLTWPIVASQDANAIVIDPTNSQILYAASDFGVAKSTNGGSNWLVTSLNGFGISSLTIDSTNPSRLYAAAYNGTAYRSTDGGTNWNPVFTDVAGKAIAFALDPTSPGTVFIGTDQGVYLSTNGGLSSGNFSAGIPTSARPVMALAYDVPGRVLYAGTQEGVFALALGPVANAPVSGQVTDIHGAGISGVTLTISGAPGGQTLTSLTDANGNYSFNNSVGGDTLTPTKSGLVFAPESVRAVSNGGPIPITGTFNFLGGSSFSTLSGRVTDGLGNGIGAVLMNVTGSMQLVVPTDSTGAYSIPVFPGGNYTITPSKTGYVFFPSPLGFTNLPPGDRTLPTIVGTTNPYSISGQVKDTGGNAMSSVAVRLSRTGAPETFTVQTNAGGNYSFSNLAREATYTLTPVKTGFRFSPVNAVFSNPGGNQVANFIGSPLPVLQFDTAGALVGNGDGKAVISVTRTGDVTIPSTVDYTSADGTASQRVHYTIASGSLSFAAGEVSKHFAVLITDTAIGPFPATVNLTLSNPGGATLGSPASAVLTISQNHSWPGGVSPVDDASFFVRQHYADFLNRESDQSGLDYWSGQITQCGNDQTCLRNRRNDVSNAFFYELEYQQTGSYVYRLYRAAFGNNQPFPNPDPNGDPAEKNKLVSYAAFVQDRARVIGGSGLAQSQLDLANVFVQRAEFTARYATNLDGPGFVDAVLATIKNEVGADLTAQRQALIDLFSQAGGGNSGRSAVLYHLADDNVQTNPIDNRAFINAEYNRAFVATQYFGYLRRDPDIGGLLFWLGQVNSAALRDVTKQHAMVCSFITSAEYQQRFSLVVTHSNSECQ